MKNSKDIQETEEHDVLARIDASDEGNGEKEDLKESEVTWADPLRGILETVYFTLDNVSFPLRRKIVPVTGQSRCVG